MQAAFYVASAIAILSTLLMLTRLNAVHALLYLIVSLLAVAVVFYILGAPFVAALEVIIYAGTIMVLFVFVVMMLNLGERATAAEKRLLTSGIWIGPAILAAALIAETAWIVFHSRPPGSGIGSSYAHPVEPGQVGSALYGPYLIAVELASFLLLSGLIGAYHLSSRAPGEDKDSR